MAVEHSARSPDFIRGLRAPFGRVGSSGIGWEGGNFSREFFTEPKAVRMQIDPA